VVAARRPAGGGSRIEADRQAPRSASLCLPYAIARASLSISYAAVRTFAGTKESPFAASNFGRDTMTNLAGAARAVLAKTSVRVSELLSRWLEHSVSRQRYRARFNNEMYRGIYRHSSKNDDDLPVVR